MSVWKYATAGCVFALSIMILRKMTRFYKRGVLTCSEEMRNKTVIITGANCGIGKATALELAKRHARVIMACRNKEKANAAISDIRKITEYGELIFKHLDLESFKSVKAFCQDIIEHEQKLHVLINNAAVMNHPYAQTEDNLEIHMSVNHFGNFLLTNLLLDLLKKSSPSRIIFVSSALHKYGRVNFEDFQGQQRKPYADSKLANVYFARELAERLKGTGISVHTLHPGMVNTELSRHSVSPALNFIVNPIKYLLLPSAEEGSQGIVNLAVVDLGTDTGKCYGKKGQEEKWPEISSEKAIWKKMWEVSERLTQLN
ncbi:retinol dehydrogenase 14-like [Saccostrea echinata]|uniref:retinol dehydrogenase 14-like n=1 Tax=Saccostrea echinata TaxID=191078 RepID=UPI002A810264|nr:retinol dehydrogenase 14-like [Saccostrea echinata]